MNYQRKCTVTIFGEGFFVEEMENGKGKSIFFVKKKNGKEEGGKYLEKENLLWRRRKTEEEKEVKIFREAKSIF